MTGRGKPTFPQHEPTHPGTRFPRVEVLRAQARAMRYTRATDAQLEQARKDDVAGVHLNAIEDSHTTPEEYAFMAMMIEERLPPRLRTVFSLRYIRSFAQPGGAQ